MVITWCSCHGGCCRSVLCLSNVTPKPRGQHATHIQLTRIVSSRRLLQHRTTRTALPAGSRHGGIARSAARAEVRQRDAERAGSELHLSAVSGNNYDIGVYPITQDLGLG